jgi:hypothetical protein
MSHVPHLLQRGAAREAALLHGRLLRVKGTELPRRRRALPRSRSATSVQVQAGQNPVARRQSPRELYHYTGADGLRRIVESNSLRARRIAAGTEQNQIVDRCRPRYSTEVERGLQFARNWLEPLHNLANFRFGLLIFADTNDA